MVARLIVVAALAAAACSKPTAVPLEPLGVEVTVQPGWSAAMAAPGEERPAQGVIRHGKRDVAYLRAGADLAEVGLDAAVWSKGPPTLETLRAACQQLKPSPDTFDRGFGVAYDDAQGGHHFAYVLTMGDRKLTCTPVPDVRPEEMTPAIAICKSTRPAR